MRENAVMHHQMLALSQSGATVWRNNTGQAWTGDVTRLADGSVLIRNPRPLHAGLCKGSSDLIGIVPHIVTPDDVGRVLGLFLAVESKAPKGRASDAQRNFVEHIQRCGGLAGVARSVDEALAVMRRIPK